MKGKLFFWTKLQFLNEFKASVCLHFSRKPLPNKNP